MANITITGCVVMDDDSSYYRQILFDYEITGCVNCDSIFRNACIAMDEEHKGMVKLQSYGSLCDDTYYGCIDPVTKLFKIVVPEDCPMASITLFFDGWSNKECCKPSPSGTCYCWNGFAEMLNGKSFTLPQKSGCAFGRYFGSSSFLGDYVANVTGEGNYSGVPVSCSGGEMPELWSFQYNKIIGFDIDAVLQSNRIDVSVDYSFVGYMRSWEGEQNVPMFAGTEMHQYDPCPYVGSGYWDTVFGYDLQGNQAWCYDTGWDRIGKYSYEVLSTQIPYAEGENCRNVKSLSNAVTENPTCGSSQNMVYGGTVNVVQ